MAVREITSASVEQAVHVLKAIKAIDHMPHFSHALMALEVQEMDPPRAQKVQNGRKY